MQPYLWKKDEHYGFDFAVYPQSEAHLHSIALVKQITNNDKMTLIEALIKITNSLNKQLWLLTPQKSIIKLNLPKK